MDVLVPTYLSILGKVWTFLGWIVGWPDGWLEGRLGGCNKWELRGGM